MELTNKVASKEGYRLDPVNWEGFGEQMHAALDVCLNRLKNARSLPWIPKPDTMRASVSLLNVSGPAEGHEGDDDGPLDAGSVFKLIERDILPYSVGNTHPRYA